MCKLVMTFNTRDMYWYYKIGDKTIFEIQDPCAI